jgi:hypothetical protein
MFKVIKIETKYVFSTNEYLKGIKFVIYDVTVEKNSLLDIISYFKKNHILFHEENGCIKFRIAAIDKKNIKKFNEIDATLEKNDKIKIALAFDEAVTDIKLFGIGYEKDALTPEGTKIRFLIRDELLLATKLNEYLSVTNDG